MKDKNVFDQELFGCTKCVGFNLRLVLRAVSQHFDNVIKPSGILGTQFNLLVMIKLLGPITINKLAELGLMDRTTLSRNIKPLEKMKLVEIKPGEDKREREIQITEEGINKLKGALPLWKEAQKQALSEIGDEQWEELRENLFGLIESVR